MILEEDVEKRYNRQLTDRQYQPRVKSLEFALKHFRDNPKVHCIVKKDRDTFKDEVFIYGSDKEVRIIRANNMKPKSSKVC